MNQTALTSFNVTKQLQQYDQIFTDTQDEWRIVVGHHPMYSAGGHGDNEDVTREFAQRFQRDKVAVFFAGHDHSLQFLKNPKYDTNVIVSGAGSTVKFDIKPHPFLQKYEQESGFSFVQVDQKAMNIKFVNLRGEQTNEINIQK